MIHRVCNGSCYFFGALAQLGRARGFASLRSGVWILYAPIIKNTTIHLGGRFYWATYTDRTL